jgi:Tfp pilus assembly protein PilF
MRGRAEDAKRRDQRTAVALLLIPLILGAALRFWFAWSWRAAPQFPADPEEGYYGTAIELLGRGMYSDGLGAVQPRAWRGPIYPTFLAMVQSVSAHPRPGLARQAQAAVSTLSIALVFALGQAVLSPLAGFAAAAALAFDPDQIAQVASLNIHGFYSFWLLLLACLSVVWIKREGAPSAAAALGAALGASLLCRSSHFLAAPLLLGAAVVWWGTGRPARRGLAIFCAAAFLALAPMAVRNAALFSEFIPLPDRNAGSGVFFCGTVATVGGAECSTVDQVLDYADAVSPGFKAVGLADPVGLFPKVFDLAVRRIEADPWRYARLCLGRLFTIWNGLWIYLGLALCAVLLAPRNRALWGVVLITASFCGYALGGGASEHMQAAVPLLAVLAGCAVDLALRRWTRSPGLLATRPVPRSLLGLSGGLAVTIYAAMLCFLAVEASRYWLPRLRGRAAVSAGDARELEALRVAAENGGAADRRRYGRASALRPASSGRVDEAGRLLDEAERAAKRGSRALALERAALARRRGLYTDERERRLLNLYRELKDDRLSSALLESIAHSHPNDSELWLSRAELAAKSGKRAEALAFAARAQELGLASDGTRRRLLSLYRGLKDYARASALLETLSGSRPGDAEPWLQRAELAVEFGRRRQAFEFSVRAEKIGPADDESRRRLLRLYVALKESGRASAILDSLTRARPGDAEPWIDKAELAADSGARSDALEALAQAEKLGFAVDPDGGRRRRAALVYQKLNENERALKLFAGLTGDFPNTPSYFSDKGLCEALMRDNDAALGDLRAAIRLDPRFLPASLTLGAILEEQGRFQDASAVYDQALSRAADDDPLREALLAAVAAAASKRSAPRR